MKLNFLIGLSLVTAFACGGDIRIALEKEQNDTHDPIQEHPQDDSSSENNEDAENEQQLADFLHSGPHDTAETSRTTGVTNCSNMSYEVYSPVGVDDPPVVVLGHGFARGADTMTGWAEHLSSWGVEVLLPTLCHYNILAGVDHEMNGQNMVELAEYHGATEVVYAGHSAGGLAAIIAASQDPDALGVLGLDATDTEGIPGVSDFIGQQYAGSVTGTGFSVMGEPSSCNSDNNGLELFEMMSESYVIKVDDADHCDFESPTDFVCEMNCESSTAVIADDEIRPLITILGTSAIMSLTGLSSNGWVLWGWR